MPITTADGFLSKEAFTACRKILLEMSADDRRIILRDVTKAMAGDTKLRKHLLGMVEQVFKVKLKPATADSFFRFIAYVITREG